MRKAKEKRITVTHTVMLDLERLLLRTQDAENVLTCCFLNTCLQT